VQGAFLPGPQIYRPPAQAPVVDLYFKGNWFSVLDVEETWVRDGNPTIAPLPHNVTVLSSTAVLSTSSGLGPGRRFQNFGLLVSHRVGIERDGAAPWLSEKAAED